MASLYVGQDNTLYLPFAAALTEDRSANRIIPLNPANSREKIKSIWLVSWILFPSLKEIVKMRITTRATIASTTLEARCIRARTLNSSSSIVTFDNRMAVPHVQRRNFRLLKWLTSTTSPFVAVSNPNDLRFDSILAIENFCLSKENFSTGI